MPFFIEWVSPINGINKPLGLVTPVGKLAITQCQDVIVCTDWVSDFTPDTVFEHPILDALNGYWHQPNRNIPVQLLNQGSVYRHRVWTALNQIPFATTRCYGQLANQLCSGARAVGNACRDNPFPFIIPCHRVIAAQSLGGYCGQLSGERFTIKQNLLAFEANYQP